MSYFLVKLIMSDGTEEHHTVSAEDYDTADKVAYQLQLNRFATGYLLVQVYAA